MSEQALYEVDGAVATLTLNRPEQMNTMSEQMLDEVATRLEQAGGDESIRVVILTGRGRAFCAGGDLSRFAAGTGRAVAGTASAEERVAGLRQATRTSELLMGMPKVTIAAINGACAGAGLAWACAADLRFCAESARFNTAFANAGLSGDFGGTWTLPRIVGPARARELYLLAEKFSSEQAERYGLVSRRFPDAELMEAVSAIAARLAAMAPLALREVKANLNEAMALGFGDLLDRESARMIRLGATDDAREAAAAFLEKRSPRFSGT
ncbi:MAG: enoyl-CoA hydratase [Candidatus Dormibacteria bacterium]